MTHTADYSLINMALTFWGEAISAQMWDTSVGDKIEPRLALYLRPELEKHIVGGNMPLYFIPIRDLHALSDLWKAWLDRGNGVPPELPLKVPVKSKTIPYWPYCEECHEPFEFDPETPFASCKCGFTEWGDPRPASYVLNPHKATRTE